VKEAMSGCLACKACSTQCPIKIDVPEFRSRFLQLYHTRYLRPMRDHLVATVESYAPLMARAPRPLTSLSISRWCASSPKNISDGGSAAAVDAILAAPAGWTPLGEHDAGAT
jgi:Fe-S oxidoreductase